jgi:hypothetical protein
MARPRKKGERHPCGKLKQNHRSDLPTSLWRRAQEAITKLQLDQRFGSEIGKLRLGGDLNDAEATAATKVADIYRRYEKLHGKRRCAASPSYVASSTGGQELADKRMTSEPIEVRDLKEAKVKAALEALQDEIARVLVAPVTRLNDSAFRTSRSSVMSWVK